MQKPSLYDKIVRICGQYQYKISKQLGSGAFADVYLATDTGTGQKVALKCIDIDTLIKGEEDANLKSLKTTLIKSEEEVMRKCLSPNLLKLFNVINDGGLRILVLEYCSGGDLAEQIDRRGKIPEREAIGILNQLIFGFATLHKNKVLHRDFKSENILIHEGVYKISDFGLAKDAGSLTNLMRHTALGTPCSMAPEVAHGDTYSSLADMWSLGVVYYEMLTGQLPFSRKVKPQSSQFQSQLQSLDISHQSKKLLQAMLRTYPNERLNWKSLYDMCASYKGVFKCLSPPASDERQSIQNPSTTPYQDSKPRVKTQNQSIGQTAQKHFQANLPEKGVQQKSNSQPPCVLTPRQRFLIYQLENCLTKLQDDTILCQHIYTSFLTPFLTKECNKNLEIVNEYLFSYCILVLSQLVRIMEESKEFLYIESAKIKGKYWSLSSQDKRVNKFNTLAEQLFRRKENLLQWRSSLIMIPQEKMRFYLYGDQVDQDQHITQTTMEFGKFYKSIQMLPEIKYYYGLDNLEKVYLMLIGSQIYRDLIKDRKAHLAIKVQTP